MCQLETPLATVRWVLEHARRRRAITVLNPAPVREGALDLVALADYLTPNEGEAARLGGVPVADHEGAARAAAVLRARGAATVVVNLGAGGALACGANGSAHAPGFAIEAVDTTAAGDAFNGALAGALGQGRDLTAALRFAHAAPPPPRTRRGAPPPPPPPAQGGAVPESARS